MICNACWQDKAIVILSPRDGAVYAICIDCYYGEKKEEDND